ncbi:MAG: class I SAM-dependent methyltransferase [bacterium]|nr:class I SAM-dependent methyltransferase [bacterium]
MSEFDAKAATWDDDPERVERAKAVADAIRAAVPLTAATAVFEYGCGTGLLGFNLKPHAASVTLADSSAGMLEVLERKILASGMTGLRPLRLDLATDPLPPDRYDLAVSLLVLHHVPDTAGLLSSFHALLREGGRIALADLDAEDGSFHGPGFEGHHGFDRESLGRLARLNGFTRVRFETVLRMEKRTASGLKVFPLFLMTAVRSPDAADP